MFASIEACCLEISVVAVSSSTTTNSWAWARALDRGAPRAIVPAARPISGSDLNVAGSCQPRQLDGQGNGDFGDQLAIWNSQAISLRDSRGACNIGGVIWPRELGTA